MANMPICEFQSKNKDEAVAVVKCRRSEVEERALLVDRPNGHQPQSRSTLYFYEKQYTKYLPLAATKMIARK
jgi:hypothetical protein